MRIVRSEVKDNEEPIEKVKVSIKSFSKDGTVQDEFEIEAEAFVGFFKGGFHAGAKYPYNALALGEKEPFKKLSLRIPKMLLDVIEKAVGLGEMGLDEKCPGCENCH